MSQHLFFLLVGLGLGGLYAVVGVGVVLHYRGTGVIHFSLAALAGYSVFVVNELQFTGDLVVPVFFIPDRVNLAEGGMATVPAVILGLLMAVLIALVVDRLVFRPLAGRSALSKVVVSIGMLVSVQRIVELKFGPTARLNQKILPSDPLMIMEGVNVPRDRFWFMLIIAVAAVAIAAFFRSSKTGLAIRAAAENPQAVSFARWSPIKLGSFTVIAAQFFVAFGLIIGQPIIGSMTAVNFTVIIVPGLTAALIGRLSSLPITVAAGLGIGMLSSEVLFLSSKSWFPTWAKSGIDDVILFVLIAGALFFFGNSLPSRGDEGSASLPPVILPKNRPWLIALSSVVVVIALVFTSGSWRFGIITSLAFSLITVSLVVLVGFVGQVSLAQAGFAGTAGFFLAKLGGGLPYPVTLLIAAVGAALLGVLVGIPALRIRGAQLAVVTIGAALAMESLVFDNPATASASGDFVADPSIFGLDLSVLEGTDFARLPFGLMVAATVIVVLVLLGNVLRGRTGRRFLAVRSNERAAASIGISVASTKLTAFALSSFLAGLGGGLITYSRGQISAESFGVFAGLAILLFAFLGGISSIQGALFAAILAPLGLLFVIGENVIGLGQYWGLVGGLGAVIQMIIAPDGIAGDLAYKIEAAKAHRAKGAGGSVASTSSAEPEPILDLSTSANNIAANAGQLRLEIRDLTVRFGGLVAVNKVSMDARSGEILGLIGPNGAGKTTFVDAVTGFVDSTGEVLLDGKSIHGEIAHKIARGGLGRTWQAMELFADMDVRSNLLVAGERASLKSVFIDAVAPHSDTKLADQILASLGLSAVAEKSPSELSLGQRKLVGIGRSLMAEPSVLLLDEPAAGLDLDESRELGRRLRALANQGLAMILIDHDMSLMLEISDQLAVIDGGIRIAYGPPLEVRNSPAVIVAYLGSSASSDADEQVEPAEGSDGETANSTKSGV